MIKHFKYLWYVIRHKWFVFVAGRKFGVPLWQLITHDLSKFRPDEWFAYAERYYGTKWNVQEFDRAWSLHLKRNPHHWNHWDGEEMPENYVREMVADWAGAGRVITGKWDLADWYYGQCHIKLHPNTRKLTEHLINLTPL